MDQPGVPPGGRYWRRSKRARSQALSCRPPPSACQMELAEWVIFPEKNPHFGSQPLSFGGGGQPATPDREWFALRFDTRMQLAPGVGAAAIRLASVFANYFGVCKVLRSPNDLPVH